MKIEAATRLVASEIPALKFRNHNPGGDWLEHKRRYIEEQPRSMYGVPTLGSETGEFNRYVLLPTKVLITLKGQKGEHHNTRQRDLDSLMEYMQTHNRLPQMESGGDYVPNILVDYEGTPWINEGNHRIKSAHRLGYRALPVRVVYFSGGELEKGPLPPDKVKAYDVEAQRLGFTFDNYGTHLNRNKEVA